MDNLKNKKGYKKGEFLEDIRVATSLNRACIDYSWKYKTLERAMTHKNKEEVKDYEAYDAMHNADGIVDKSLSPSKL